MSSKSSKPNENRIIKNNISTILEHSTVVPFRWHKQFFMCFYCHLYIQTFDALKVHMDTEHPNPNINPVVALIKKDEKVKVDISSMTCKVCNHTPIDLNSLIDHLKTHQLLDNDSETAIIPYKLRGEFRCGICNENFQYFVNLNQHMNGHYSQHVCEVCGKLFLSTERLKSHKLLHTAKFPCNMCPEVFDTAVKRTNHRAEMHDEVKSFKCFYCPESFPTKAGRNGHLKAEHEVIMPVFDCPVCKKPFRNESRRQYHLKNVHKYA